VAEKLDASRLKNQMSCDERGRASQQEKKEVMKNPNSAGSSAPAIG
jgi:hypothetical protein